MTKPRIVGIAFGVAITVAVLWLLLITDGHWSAAEVPSPSGVQSAATRSLQLDGPKLRASRVPASPEPANPSYFVVDPSRTPVASARIWLADRVTHRRQLDLKPDTTSTEDGAFHLEAAPPFSVVVAADGFEPGIFAVDAPGAACALTPARPFTLRIDPATSGRWAPTHVVLQPWKSPMGLAGLFAREAVGNPLAGPRRVDSAAVRSDGTVVFHALPPGSYLAALVSGAECSTPPVTVQHPSDDGRLLRAIEPSVMVVVPTPAGAIARTKFWVSYRDGSSHTCEAPLREICDELESGIENSRAFAFFPRKGGQPMVEVRIRLEDGSSGELTWPAIPLSRFDEPLYVPMSSGAWGYVQVEFEHDGKAVDGIELQAVAAGDVHAMRWDLRSGSPSRVPAGDYYINPVDSQPFLLDALAGTRVTVEPGQDHEVKVSLSAAVHPVHITVTGPAELFQARAAVGLEIPEHGIDMASLDWKRGETRTFYLRPGLFHVSVGIEGTTSGARQSFQAPLANPRIELLVERGNR